MNAGLYRVTDDQSSAGERALLRLAAVQIQRLSDLERRVCELEEWLPEMSEDLTTSEETEVE